VPHDFRFGEALMPEYARYGSLRDRVVLVTGGGSGIGASIVEEFTRQGSSVAFLDRNRQVSEALIASLAEAGAHQPVFLPCDLTDIAALQAAVKEVNQLIGPPAVLVNNAGSDDRHDFEKVTVEYWDQRIAINLRHYFFAAQAVSAGMKAMGHGAIINLSSIAWMIPTPDVPVYAIAKAGILGLTRSLSLELGGSNIRVNSVSPGAVLTERQRRLWWSPGYEKEVLSCQHLKQHVLPTDIARLTLFLAADDSSAITSQNHVIDGGWM
jgi:NAD(P)-dependent dehydrogenase (short-subunit alcohol dehydrogenase family)